MTERELFEKTFSALHASPDTLSEVKRTMQNEKKTRRILGRGTVIAIAAALTLTVAVAGGVVLIRADVSPAEEVDDTTHHAFTDDIDSPTPVVIGNSGEVITVADMERIPGAPATTERLVGQYLSKLDAEMTVEGNTYKMGTFLVDDTGTGILTFSVENPNGFEYGDMGYGETWIESVRARVYYGRSEPTRGDREGAMSADTKLYVDESASTDTCLQVIAYFISGKGFSYAKDSTFYFSVSDGAYQYHSIAIQTQTRVPVKTFTADNGEIVLLSPLGMTAVDTIGHEIEWLIWENIIQFKDGSEFAAESRERNLRNWVVGYITGDPMGGYSDAMEIELGVTGIGAEEYYSYQFNRLVDVDEVTSITLDGPDGCVIYTA